MANPLYDTLFGRHAGQQTPFLLLPDGATLTHKAFLAIVSQYANAITNLGLNAGERLAVQIEKSPEALAVYAACAQTGVVFLPLNTAYTASEVEYFVENSGAKLVLCSTASLEEMSQIIARHNGQCLTLDADGSGTFCDFAKSLPTHFDTVERKSEDLAAFLYTSGTTGRSKGAMLTQNNLLSNAQTLVDHWRFTADDTLLHALPIFHTHGLFVATNVSLLAGGAMIFLPKFNVDDVLAGLSSATTMMGVPTFYTRLLGDARFTKELAGHMRLFISGSAPLLAETHKQFEERTGHRILERYGMTETNMNTSNPYDGERRAGTVGFALSGVELKITNPETGAILPDGEIGQIEVRGPNVFKGYWKMPEKTKEELREDGFFITGDLGQIDSDGYVHIVGRNKDLIISGGYNIYPKEVELALDDEDGVLESAVIGVPHPDFGETVVAVVIAEEGSTLDTDRIQENLGNSLARFKQPKKIVTLAELPRNTMGKVQKNILRDEFKALFQ